MDMKNLINYISKHPKAFNKAKKILREEFNENDCRITLLCAYCLIQYRKEEMENGNT